MQDKSASLLEGKHQILRVPAAEIHKIQGISFLKLEDIHINEVGISW